jgi:hypothetical protein
MKEFECVLCFFFVPSSVAFNCYSLKGEKHITREEIFQLLKSSVLRVSKNHVCMTFKKKEILRV